MCRSKTRSRGRDNRTHLVKQDNARQPADSTGLNSTYDSDGGRPGSYFLLDQ